MNCPGMFEFILETPVRCPLCHGPVTEKSLLDRVGGIEVTALGIGPRPCWWASDMLDIDSATALVKLLCFGAFVCLFFGRVIFVKDRRYSWMFFGFAEFLQSLLSCWSCLPQLPMPLTRGGRPRDLH
jgi:hypothetical protein